MSKEDVMTDTAAVAVDYCGPIDVLVVGTQTPGLEVRP